MSYIIIAMSTVNSKFYPILSFGFETYKECQIFITEMIVSPEINMIYGCFRTDI